MKKLLTLVLALAFAQFGWPQAQPTSAPSPAPSQNQERSKLGSSGQTATAQQPSEYVEAEKPSAQYQLAQYKDTRFMYPLNWQVKTTNTGWLVIGPRFGLLNNGGIACGITMGSFTTKESFPVASANFISWMKSETPGGVQEREPASNISVGGRQGSRWSFQAMSLLPRKDQREVDDVIIVPLNKGRIWWAVFTSLLQDRDFLQPAFSKLLQTIAFNDSSADLKISSKEAVLRLTTGIDTTEGPGEVIEGDVQTDGGRFSITGYILEVRSNKENGSAEIVVFVDNLRSRNSSAWISADLIGVRNSKGQRGVDDNGVGILLSNSEIPLVTAWSAETPFFTPESKLVENKVDVFSTKIRSAHLAAKNSKLSLGKGSELVMRISEWTAQKE